MRIGSGLAAAAAVAALLAPGADARTLKAPATRAGDVSLLVVKLSAPRGAAARAKPSRVLALRRRPSAGTRVVWALRRRGRAATAVVVVERRRGAAKARAAEDTPRWDLRSTTVAPVRSGLLMSFAPLPAT